MNKVVILVTVLCVTTVSSFENGFLHAFTPGIDILIEENLDKVETYENVKFNYTISCNKLWNLTRHGSDNTSRTNDTNELVILPSRLQVYLHINDTAIADFESTVSPVKMELECENETEEMIQINTGHLGITKLNVEFRDGSNSASKRVEIDIRIKRKVTSFDVWSFYILGPLILLNKCAFGAKIDVNTLKNIFTQPIELGFCLTMQFVAMPLFAYIYGNLFYLSEALALALFVGATCPGGGGGYVFSFLVGGDVTLAISASLMSTVVAMGAMPATIGIYTYVRHVPNNIVIPYIKMVMMLAVIAIPISLGMYINRTWPEVAKKFVKIIRPLSLFLIFCGFGFLAVTSKYIIHGPAIGWALAVVLPMSGFVSTIILARCFGMSWPFAKAISLETGMKNTVLGIAVIELTYPQPEADLSSILIIMVTLGHTTISMLWYFCHLIREKCCTDRKRGATFTLLKNVDSDEDDLSEAEFSRATR